MTRAHARVLLVGMGGIGCLAAMALARAGIGTLGLCDDDEVQLSNLHRQILFSLEDVGQSKVDAAAKRLGAFAVGADVIVHCERLMPDRAVDLVSDYDIVLEGADNFATKFLAADACRLAGVPVVHASAVRWVATALAVGAGGRPCYRCVFPEPPPPELAPSCDEAGTLGILPGIIGLFEANEAVKMLLGIGEPLVGRLLMIDALTDEFRTLRLKRDPKCPVCGEGAHFKDFVDYEVSTAIPTPA